jgi:hypothetical protein
MLKPVAKCDFFMIFSFDDILISVFARPVLADLPEFRDHGDKTPPVSSLMYTALLPTPPGFPQNLRNPIGDVKK